MISFFLNFQVGNGPEATGKKMIGMYYEGKLKSNNKGKLFKIITTLEFLISVGPY